MSTDAAQRERIGFEQRDGLLDDARCVDELRLSVPNIAVSNNRARPSERLLYPVETDRTTGRPGHID